MKRTEITWRSASLLLALAVFASCESDINEPAATGEALQISVAAQGFSSGAPETRATDAAYTTTFANGDEIGITVIENGSTILQNNVPYRYNVAQTKWEPLSANNYVCAYSGAITYLAYYPYSATMDGKTTAAEILADFTPQTDQSDQADYTASDLMTGTGTINGATLEISLAHALSLVEINMPKYASAPKLKVNGGTEYTTYMFASGQYRCIVKPAAGASLNSSYTHSIPLAWQKTGVNLAAGKYTKVSVKNPSIPLFEDAGVVIAGKIWATRNVDFPGTFAPAPESYGMIYQWNRSVGWLNYSGAPLLNSNGGTTWDATNASGDTWAPENNPCPDGWRVPTKEELQDLRNAGVSNWTSRNGINGRYFGPGGNQIFLPAAGHRGNSNGSFDTVGSCGYYWSSMWYSGIASYHLLFDSGIIYSAVGNRRSYGFSVRCVKE